MLGLLALPAGTKRTAYTDPWTYHRRVDGIYQVWSKTFYLAGQMGRHPQRQRWPELLINQ